MTEWMSGAAGLGDIRWSHHGGASARRRELRLALLAEAGLVPVPDRLIAALQNELVDTSLNSNRR
jgi:hypothetical protein